MQLLLKTANHLALLCPKRTPSVGQKEHVRRFCSDIFRKNPSFSHLGEEAGFAALSEPVYSGKMKVICGVWPEHSVLILARSRRNCEGLWIIWRTILCLNKVLLCFFIIWGLNVDWFAWNRHVVNTFTVQEWPLHNLLSGGSHIVHLHYHNLLFHWFYNVIELLEYELGCFLISYMVLLLSRKLIL